MGIFLLALDLARHSGNSASRRVDGSGNVEIERICDRNAHTTEWLAVGCIGYFRSRALRRRESGDSHLFSLGSEYGARIVEGHADLGAPLRVAFCTVAWEAGPRESRDRDRRVVLGSDAALEARRSPVLLDSAPGLLERLVSENPRANSILGAETPQNIADARENARESHGRIGDE